MVHALQNVSIETEAVITVGVDHPDVNAAIDALVDKGITVVTAVSDSPQSKRHLYVGQDNFQAGRTAGQVMAAMIPPGPGDVYTFIGHLQFRHLLDRRAGFEQALGLSRPDLHVHSSRPYGNREDVAIKIMREIKETTPNLRGIYLSGAGQPWIFNALIACKPPDAVAIAHELTPYSRLALQQNTLSALVGHNLNDVADKALKLATNPNPNLDPACAINVYFPANLPIG